MNEHDKKAWAAVHFINLSIYTPLGNQYGQLREQAKNPDAPWTIARDIESVTTRQRNIGAVIDEIAKDTELRRNRDLYWKLFEQGKMEEANKVYKNGERLEAEMFAYRKELSAITGLRVLDEVAAGIGQ